MKKVVAVIQARMGSTRLPGKILLEIEGKPLIQHIYERLKNIQLIDEIVIATTNSSNEKYLEDFAKNQKISLYKGKENDLANRILEAAHSVKGTVIVKINADSPIIDTKLIYQGIEKYFNATQEPDLVTNTIDKKFPEGLQFGIFNVTSLEKFCYSEKSNFWREYFFMYFIENQDNYSIQNIESNVDLSNIRLTVDYQEDLDFIRKIFSNLYNTNPFFGLEEILGLLEKQPKLLEINKKFVKNSFSTYEEEKSNYLTKEKS